MKIPEALLTSLMAQYRLAQENAQAKLPTTLSLAIEAIGREFEDLVNASAEVAIREDQRRRLEGPKHDYDEGIVRTARMAGL